MKTIKWVGALVLAVYLMIPLVRVTYAAEKFVDKENRISFEIPDGWFQTSTELAGVNASFLPQRDEEHWFSYIATDIYSMQDYASIGVDRGDMGFDSIDKSLLEDTLRAGLGEEGVSYKNFTTGVTKFGDTDFYCATYGAKYDQEWFDVKMHIAFVDGIQYTFSFFGDRNDECYSDYTAMLKTTHIGEVKVDSKQTIVEDNKTVETKAETVQVNGPERDYTMVISVGVIATVFIVMLIYLLVKKKPGNRHSVQKNKVNVSNSRFYNKVQGEVTVRFCHKCGFELIKGSGFCSKCGTKVPEGN